MNKTLTLSATLHNGVKMPWLGLGVWRVDNGDEVRKSVQWALETGYRHIDTAAVYGNEEGVGDAIRQSGVKREDLFVTTKLWNADQGYETGLKAFEESRRKLGLDVVDLYLIHWPVKGKYKESWKALQKLYKEGLVRAIGVSNFQIHHLEDLMANAEIAPMVNQVEFHPRLHQKPLLDYCRKKNIQLEAWSPLMQGNLDHPTLQQIGQKYGKSAAQVILRWDIQQEVITIPKSVRESRIRENSDIFDFELTAEDMEKIGGINENRRYGADPDNFNF